MPSIAIEQTPRPLSNHLERAQKVVDKARDFAGKHGKELALTATAGFMLMNTACSSAGTETASKQTTPTGGAKIELSQSTAEATEKPAGKVLQGIAALEAERRKQASDPTRFLKKPLREIVGKEDGMNLERIARIYPQIAGGEKAFTGSPLKILYSIEQVAVINSKLREDLVEAVKEPSFQKYFSDLQEIGERVVLGVYNGTLTSEQSSREKEFLRQLQEEWRKGNRVNTLGSPPQAGENVPTWKLPPIEERIAALVSFSGGSDLPVEFQMALIPTSTPPDSQKVKTLLGHDAFKEYFRVMGEIGHEVTMSAYQTSLQRNSAPRPNPPAGSTTH